MFKIIKELRERRRLQKEQRLETEREEKRLFQDLQRKCYKLKLAVFEKVVSSKPDMMMATKADVAGGVCVSMCVDVMQNVVNRTVGSIYQGKHDGVGRISKNEAESVPGGPCFRLSITGNADYAQKSAIINIFTLGQAFYYEENNAQYGRLTKMPDDLFWPVKTDAVAYEYLLYEGTLKTGIKEQDAINIHIETQQETRKTIHPMVM